MKLQPGELSVPERAHECSPPMWTYKVQDAAINNPPPEGSQWRCPHCLAYWQVQRWPEVYSGAQRVGCRWVRVSSGRWSRLRRRLWKTAVVSVSDEPSE